MLHNRRINWKLKQEEFIYYYREKNNKLVDMNDSWKINVNVEICGHFLICFKFFSKIKTKFSS